MNKKGVLGFNTAYAVMLGLLVLAVIAITMFLAITQLQTAAESAETLQTGSVNNESITPSSIGNGAGLAYVYLRNAKCTLVQIVNNSGGIVINSANYTQGGQGNCYIKNTTGEFPLSWNVSYTYTYNRNYTYMTTEAVIHGTTGFFGYVPTFFILIAVVVLILMIAIVIVAVSRFGGGSAVESSEPGPSLEAI